MTSSEIKLVFTNLTSGDDPASLMTGATAIMILEVRSLHCCSYADVPLALGEGFLRETVCSCESQWHHAFSAANVCAWLQRFGWFSSVLRKKLTRFRKIVFCLSLVSGESSSNQVSTPFKMTTMKS